MNIRNVLSPILILVSVLCMVSAQFPVSRLCSTITCPFESVCRVFQSCRNCPPAPNCVRCLPRDVDYVCNRNGYSHTVLVPGSLSPRKCDSLFGDCPFDSDCVPDGIGRGSCCYRNPITTPPVCGF